MIENLGEVLQRHCLASLGDKKFAFLADESTDKQIDYSWLSTVRGMIKDWFLIILWICLN